ncbi:MAG: GntR family transcriptional regulator [Aestuariibaculum sp.]
MEFKSNKGIFIQIAENICNQILAGNLQSGDRIPSVRDLASNFEVNRNTVMRTYTYLQDQNIIENKRGIGFFVSQHAKKQVLEKEKQEFFKNELPYLIKKIGLLKLNSNDLSELIIQIKNNDIK